MTTRLRFTLLLGLLLGGFLLASAGLRRLAESERAGILASDRQARGQFLNHWLDAIGRELPQLATEMAQSEEFSALLRHGDNADAQTKIGSALAQANVTSLWVVRADGSVVLQSTAHRDGGKPPLPLDAAEIVTLLAETPSPRFFAQTGPDLFEISVRRLQAGASRDWIFVARRWDDTHLRALSALTESTISLQRAHDMARPAAPDSRLVLFRPVHGWRGQVERVLRLDYELPETERALREDGRQVQLFVVFGLLVLAAMALAVHSWVLQPLQKIRDSLAADDSAKVTPLSKEKTEFGNVARLLLSSFEQREELRLEIAERKRMQDALTLSEAALHRNIEERARLGRNLHDGIIQSLYATGMGLAGIRAQLKPDQVEAATRLDQTRGALNETIHDVRNFIAGLEPEALKVQSFSHAVAALLEAMRSMRAFRSALDIDDQLAARLTLAQRAHALQIAREAVSNALRHGEADQIKIVLQQHDHIVEFDVEDNGCGFDATLSEPQGSGLGNFVQRARELGAVLKVQSQRGRGTRVQLSFSLP